MTLDKNSTDGTDTATDNADELRAKLVMETASLPWAELQRFYARGQVVRVAPGLDLIDVAMAVAQDDKARVQPWMEQDLFGEVATDQAQVWFDSDASLWAVVVAPWVLVQEGKDSPAAGKAEVHRH